ncbi:MAG: hypothetical protein ABSF26_29770, partial [Thermoguttaceae bacterium]
GLWIVSPVSAGTIADVSALPLGTDATIDQAVILSTTDLTADPLYKSFQLRDTTRAITIYGTNADIDAALTGFGVGGVITISGQTGDVGGALALVRSIAGFAVSGRTTTLPLLTNAVFVSPSDIAQPYESNLVCLQDVSFADTSLGPSTFAVGDYALTNGAVVRISSDDLGLTGLAIPSGPLDITGIVIPSDPTSGSYCLAPRGPADMVSTPEPSSLTLLVLGGVGILFMLQSVRMKRYSPLLFVLAGLWIVSPVSAGTIADVSALPLGTDATIDQTPLGRSPSTAPTPT